MIQILFLAFWGVVALMLLLLERANIKLLYENYGLNEYNIMKKNFLRYTKIFEKNSTIPKYVSAVDALARQTNNF